MDRVKQIEAFVSVATRGSLSAAARAEGAGGSMRWKHASAPDYPMDMVRIGG